MSQDEGTLINASYHSLSSVPVAVHFLCAGRWDGISVLCLNSDNVNIVTSHVLQV